MPITLEATEIQVIGARNCFTHSVEEDEDVENLLKLLLAESMARNHVVVILCVGKDRLPQVAITDR